MASDFRQDKTGYGLSRKFSVGYRSAEHGCFYAAERKENAVKSCEDLNKLITIGFVLSVFVGFALGWLAHCMAGMVS